MDNLIWIIYIIDTLLDSVLGFGIVIAVALSIFLIIVLVNLGEARNTAETHNGNAYYKNKATYWEAYNTKRPLVILCFLIPVLILIPSKTTAYKLLAIYGGVELLKTPEMQEIGGKGMEVLNKAMNEYLDESTGE